MIIIDFEKYFDQKSLSRGLGYFKSGNIADLEYDGEEWVAEVTGSEDYTVTALLSSNGEIIESHCDCPYDWDEYCKHQAAVFYALRDKWQSGQISSAKPEKKKKLGEMLKNLDRQALESIILEFAGKDRRMKEELFLRFAGGSDTLESAKTVIKSAIGAVKRRGYVEYGDTGQATDGAYTVLQMADDKIDSGDIETAISLCITVSEEMMELLDYCDDSNGEVGGAISESIEKIGDAVSSMPSDQINSEMIFNIVFEHALDPMYDGWTDWRMDLLSMIADLCDNHNNRAKMETYLSEQQNGKAEGWSREYENRQLQGLQYGIIKRFDGKNAADAYMEQHLDNSDFRLTAIQSAISSGQYERALSLCLEGEQKDSGYAGLLKKWKEIRYTIYEKSKDIHAQKDLGTEMLLHGDFKYFNKLKALYASSEWPVILEGILGELEKDDRNRSYGNSVYISILIQERLKSKLMDYCNQHIHTIASYYEHLLPEYKENVGALFAKYIMARSASADGRKQYRDVCDLIRHYKKACGNEALAIRDELRVTYAKRPAFLDELSKV